MSTIYKDKNITKMYYGSTPVYSFSVEDGGGTGGDTTTYSYKTPTADVEGLKVLGWDDESIGYFRDNNLCYDWQKDNYIVTEGNKELYGVVTKNNISTYKSDPNFVYCPMIDTSNATNLNRLFYQCFSLKSIPLLDTSNASYMGELFSECSSLLTIPLLDCGNATNLNRLFHQCSSLQSIPPLNTSNVNYMGELFRGCSSLSTIPLLDCGNATGLTSMFRNCSSLQSIPPLNTSNASDMSNMFYGCSLLQSIPELDTGNATNMNGMFYGCSKLTTIPKLNTSNVSDMSNMFYSCSSLSTIPLLDCGNVTKMNTFFGYSNINTLTDLGGFKDLKISVTSGFLERTPKLTVESLMNVINNLYDLTANGLSEQTLKFGSTNLNKLTTEQVAIAIAKGWTLTA